MLVRLWFGQQQVGDDHHHCEAQRGSTTTSKPAAGATTTTVKAAGSATTTTPKSGATPTTTGTGKVADGVVEVGTTSLGKVLTNGAGLTLYISKSDVKGVSSSCNETCASTWIPDTVVTKATAGTGVNSALLSTIKRSDGSKQITYDGWPLYHYKNDAKRGETNGEKVSNEWFHGRRSRQDGLMRALPAVGVVLFAGSTLAFASSVHTDAVFTLTTPYPDVETQPGSTVKLDVSVSSSTVDAVELSLSGLPDGWKATMRGGGFVIHAVTATADAPAKAQLEIAVPPGQTRGLSN